MKYSIVYSSKTGNTAQLAERIRDCLPQGRCTFCGAPPQDTTDATLIFAGFWTDRGSCGGEMPSFLKSLHHKKVFLFGTAGFGGDPAYFAQILSRAADYLDSSNTVIGSFMCQGKMPPGVRHRYEALYQEDPDRVRKMLENFDSALSHPDDADLERLEALVRKLVRDAPECL